MPESRISQLAQTPIIQDYAQAKSQKAIRRVGKFIAPLVLTADVVVHYKNYTKTNQFRIPDTKRGINGAVTQVGMTGDDVTVTLEPNALDLPLPNLVGLSDQAVSMTMMQGMDVLAGISGLALEYEQISIAVAGAGTTLALQYSDNTKDPIGDAVNGLDFAIEQVMLAAPGAAVRVLFGKKAFRLFRNNAFVRGRFVVGRDRGAGSGAGGVGLVSPNINDVSGLLDGNPEVDYCTGIVDNTKPGLAAAPQFIMSSQVLVFAANEEPNLFDTGFMKTFAPMAGFFRPGTYIRERQDIEVAKMDWITRPVITNAPAGYLVNVT